MIKKIDYDDVKFFFVGRSYFGLSLYTTGFYFVDGLLIDSGPPNMKKEIKNLLSGLSVAQLVNTHHHEDHVGNNSTVEKMFNIAPKIHFNGAGIVKSGNKNLDCYRRLAWGIPKPSIAEAIGDVVKTPKYEFQVLYTPGHSDDHICLYEPKKKWLFTGDLYISEKLKVLEKNENIYQIIKSLKLLASLPVETIFCAHRGKFNNGRQLLLNKIKYLEELGSTINSLHNKGLNTKQICDEVFPPDLIWRLFTRGEFSSRNLVAAYLNNIDN